MAISMTNAVTGDVRRARRIIKCRDSGPTKRRANRRHRRARHEHEHALLTDVHADYVPPRKLTGWDIA